MKLAGLSWKEFCSQIEEISSCRTYRRYHVLSMLLSFLTLLPNIKKLTLPARCKPLPTTHQLLDAISTKSRETEHAYHNASLSSLISFRSIVPSKWMEPFFGLPWLHSVCVPLCVWIGPSKCGSVSDTQETAALDQSHLSITALASLFNRLPRLRSLKFSTITITYPKIDVCKFVKPIGREVGKHLTVLSILYGLSYPQSMNSLQYHYLGKSVMREFQLLRRLKPQLNIILYTKLESDLLSTTFSL